MKYIFFLICALAFEQLSNNLKKLISSDLEPFSEMKMRSLSQKMQKNPIYEIVKVPRDLYPFEVFQNMATGGYLPTDENGRLDENIDLHQANDYGENTGTVNFIDLECADETKHTPFWKAARNGHIEIVKFLAEQNVDLECADSDGCTPVWVAAASGYTEIVKFLAEQKVNLEHADDYGRTSVWMAASYGRIEIVKFLAEEKVDLERADSYGRTPVYIAAKIGHTEIVKYLIEKNVELDENLLKIASTEEIKNLIAKEFKK